MTWFDELKTQVMVVMPNMPTSYIENAILNAVTRFFRETHLLKDEVYIDCECGIDDYVMDIPTGRTILKIEQVRYTSDAERHPLINEAWEWVKPANGQFERGYWVDLTAASPTIRFDRHTVRNKGRYGVIYSWTPTDKNCDLPHHLVGKYLDGLLSGALYTLYLLPTEMNTQSATLATHYMKEFYRVIRTAQVEETQNHTNRPLFMQGVSFI